MYRRASEHQSHSGWMLLLAIGLPALAVALLGPDGNWDLRNYHLYNPHAWLTGRLYFDIAPAQLQSWHNPMLDVPLYWLYQSSLSAHWASAWLTLPYIAALWFLLRLQQVLAPVAPTRASQLALAFLAVTGAAFFSTLGTSSNDGIVAAVSLACLLLVIDSGRDDTSGRYDTAPRRWLLAGLLAGAVAGLKLVAIIYCIGLACAAFVHGPLAARARRIGALALGGLAGFLLTYGYWGWQLNSLRGNPFFPYFNHVFRSADALPIAHVDARFRPESLLDALMAPIHLLERSSRFSEIRLSDPRLLLGLVGLAGLWLLYRKSPDAIRRKGVILLLVFFLASYLVWLPQYGIYRYAITLEMLGCLALVLLLQQLPRWRNLALLMAVMLVSADTKRPKWAHYKTSAAPMAGIVAPAIRADSLVLLAADEPLAYLALGLPSTVRMVSVHNNFMHPARCTGLQRAAGAAIADHPGPVWLLVGQPSSQDSAQALLTEYYGLAQDGRCVPFVNSLQPAQLCPQRQAAPMPGTMCR